MGKRLAEHKVIGEQLDDKFSRASSEIHRGNTLIERLQSALRALMAANQELKKSESEYRQATEQAKEQCLEYRQRLKAGELELENEKEKVKIIEHKLELCLEQLGEYSAGIGTKE